MPKVTRWFVKAAILYLITGVFLALITEIPAVDAGPLLLPLHYEMAIWGWLVQFVMGTSYWMFPFGSRRKTSKCYRET